MVRRRFPCRPNSREAALPVLLHLTLCLPLVVRGFSSSVYFCPTVQAFAELDLVAEFQKQFAYSCIVWQRHPCIHGFYSWNVLSHSCWLFLSHRPMQDRACQQSVGVFLASVVNLAFRGLALLWFLNCRSAQEGCFATEFLGFPHYIVLVRNHSLAEMLLMLGQRKRKLVPLRYCVQSFIDMCQHAKEENKTQDSLAMCLGILLSRYSYTRTCFRASAFRSHITCFKRV
eukprot:1390198-Amphidinium_carterae.1